MHVCVENDACVEGPVGPAGPHGEQGLVGMSGLPGMCGADGSEGERGDQGLRGQAGIKGLPGPKPPQGRQGRRGDEGADGAQGRPGRQGVNSSVRGQHGVAGRPGPPGRTGQKGYRGDAGPPGHAGVVGQPGQIGRPGAVGQRGQDALPLDEFKISQDIDRRLDALIVNLESEPVFDSLAVIASRFVGLGNNGRSFCECVNCDKEECGPVPTVPTTVRSTPTTTTAPLPPQQPVCNCAKDEPRMKDLTIFFDNSESVTSLPLDVYESMIDSIANIADKWSAEPDVDPDLNSILIVGKFSSRIKCMVLHFYIG